MLDAIDARCKLLAEHPRIGRARLEIAAEARSFPVGNYLILYRLDENGVEIVRVVWGGRKLDDLFE